MAKKRGRAKAVKPSATIKVEADVTSNDKNEDVVSAPIATSVQPVLLKICRLCETKDGPFLNIFESDTIISRKLKDLMPFTISENDSLPHKICFRCSAKVEEFHEFVQKCVKCQDNLTKLYSRVEAPPTKTKARQLWEEKLNESKMSNDDICDALIKMAMEGLKDAPLKAQDPKLHSDPDEIEDIPLKQVKQSLEKSESRNVAKRSRTRATDLSDSSIESPSSSKAKISQVKEDKSEASSAETAKKSQNADDINNLSFDYDDKPLHKTVPSKKAKPTPKSPEKDQPKPFNIKEHVSMIKVNGVGVLFQCKLCNRNFLKKDIVATHGCAKNGVPKEDFTSNIPPPPEPPKPSVVKYINTKIDEIKKPVASPTPAVTAPPPVKPKPRIGPASRVKKDIEPTIGMVVTPTETGGEKSTVPVVPTVSFPSLPNLKNSYKLVPGPNNTFTLVEETSKNAGISVTKVPAQAVQKNKDQTIIPSVINLDDSPPSTTQSSQPYPVGLFQTLPHHSEGPVPSAFPTLASKKQSYTIVQTGNPSKLLISTKAQPPAQEPPPNQAKRPRKSKAEVKDNTYSGQSFNVAEDKNAPKSDFFTFVNLDPLLQPSYVLPTPSIVQESQISTSTPPNPANVKKNDTSSLYSCNMCSESFSREKKLLAHIQSHFNSMDEEDRKRNDVNTRKKTRK